MSNPKSTAQVVLQTAGLLLLCPEAAIIFLARLE
jgi:hypothetical protein